MMNPLNQEKDFDIKLERFTYMLLYCLSHKPEIINRVRQIAKYKKDGLKGAPLTKNQVLQRLGQVASYPYLENNCLYFAKEVYDVFSEYSRFDVVDLLKLHNLIVNQSVQKRHPITRKKQRAFIIDVNR